MKIRKIITFSKCLKCVRATPGVNTHTDFNGCSLPQSYKRTANTFSVLWLVLSASSHAASRLKLTNTEMHHFTASSMQTRPQTRSFSYDLSRFLLVAITLPLLS